MKLAKLLKHAQVITLLHAKPVDLFNFEVPPLRLQVRPFQWWNEFQLASVFLDRRPHTYDVSFRHYRLHCEAQIDVLNFGAYVESSATTNLAAGLQNPMCSTAQGGLMPCSQSGR